MKPGQQQRQIFDFLKTLIPPGHSLADAIGSILHLSSDSTYRRLRGETPLTIDELQGLCGHFGVSANQLLQQGDDHQVMFQVNRSHLANQSFAGYISNVLQQLQMMKTAGVEQFVYASKDLPLFHSFLLPEFFAFKYHFWMHVITGHPDYQDKPFEKAVSDTQMTQMTRQCLSIYNQIPSIEIWNSESINSTLWQIDYYRHQQYFGSAADLRALYDLLDQILLHVEKQAEYGTKFLPGEIPELRSENFELFFNQVVLSDNTMLLTNKTHKLAILNYGVLHYLLCHDQSFCQSVEEDLSNIIRRATKLSSGNIRQRARFFNQLHEKVDGYRKQI
jgi:hypothetical protein